MITFSDERIASQISEMTTDDTPDLGIEIEPSQSCESPDHTGAKRWGNNRYKAPKAVKRARAKIAKASQRRNRK